MIRLIEQVQSAGKRAEEVRQVMFYMGYASFSWLLNEEQRSGEYISLGHLIDKDWDFRGLVNLEWLKLRNTHGIKLNLTGCHKLKRIQLIGETIGGGSNNEINLGYREDVEFLKNQITSLTQQLTEQQASKQAQINQLQSQIQVKEQELSRVRNETVNSTAPPSAPGGELNWESKLLVYKVN